jgi:hypothetical protein
MASFHSDLRRLGKYVTSIISCMFFFKESKERNSMSVQASQISSKFWTVNDV